MYKIFVALRYLRANKVIYFSIAGVAVGIMVMIIVTSVMSGFSRDILTRVRGLQSHFVLKSRWADRYIDDYDVLVKEMRGIRGVAGVAPRIEYAAWLSYRGSPRNVMVVGINPEDERGTSDVERFFANERGDTQGAPRDGFKGSFDFLYPDGTPPEKPGIVVGSEIFPVLGMPAMLQTVRKGDTPMVLGCPVIVVGSFKSGMAEYDSTYLFMDLKAMQTEFMRLGPPHIRRPMVTTIAISVKDYEREGAAIKQSILETHHRHRPCGATEMHKVGYCGAFYVQSWEEVRSILLQAVAIERGIQVIILFCIVIVAGFNIIAIYTMMVRAKTRDVGVLRSLGATKGGVTSIFLVSGGLCGLFGSGFGILLGTLVATNLNEIVGFVRITSRELNRLAFTPGPDAVRATSVAAVAVLLAAFVLLLISWRGLYKSFSARAWIWSGLAASLAAGGCAIFFSWAGTYKPVPGDDPSLPKALPWILGAVACGLILFWTVVRQATDAHREKFLGGFVRIAGTVLYSLLALVLFGMLAVSAALLIVQPNRVFQGWDLFPRQVYYLDKVPVLIDPVAIVFIVLATLGVSVIFSIYPALRAASYNPIEAIRDE